MVGGEGGKEIGRGGGGGIGLQPKRDVSRSMIFFPFPYFFHV